MKRFSSYEANGLTALLLTALILTAILLILTNRENVHLKVVSPVHAV